MAGMTNFRKWPLLRSQNGRARLGILCLSTISLGLLGLSAQTGRSSAAPQEAQNSLRGQSQEEADRKSAGCISCHTSEDEPTMHPSKGVHLGCTDCHGGVVSAGIAPGTAANSAEYNAVKEKAHVQPRSRVFKQRDAVPRRIFTEWLKESAEYVKFVNPGDLRVAPETCGTLGCHASETRAVSTNMMTHAGMLWGAARKRRGRRACCRN